MHILTSPVHPNGRQDNRIVPVSADVNFILVRWDEEVVKVCPALSSQVLHVFMFQYVSETLLSLLGEEGIDLPKF
jgi:hypothetical protein